MVRQGSNSPSVESLASPTDLDQPTRPMRADAQKNRERLVTAAREELVASAGGWCMEAIAKRAGVGVGTLYRHFPKRLDVVEAVYRTDVDQLVDRVDGLSNLSPWDALVAWLEAYLDYARSKRVFLNELHEAFEQNPTLKVESRDRIERALGDILRRAQDAGEVRTDIDAADLFQLLGTMCMSATLTPEQAQRLLIVILDGLGHVDASTTKSER